MKEGKCVDESVVHHVHHDERIDEYKREITVQGINITVTLSSNSPEEDMEYLIDRSVKILRDIKEIDHHE